MPPIDDVCLKYFESFVFLSGTWTDQDADNVVPYGVYKAIGIHQRILQFLQEGM